MKSVLQGYGERPIKQKAGTRQSLRLVSFGSKRPCLSKLDVFSLHKLCVFIKNLQVCMQTWLAMPIGCEI